MRANFLAFLLAGVMGLLLFSVKHKIQHQEKHLKELHHNIKQTQEAIHVLKAEWAYLNEPLRLQKLTLKYTGLQPLQPSQILQWDTIPMKG
jgi:hypothetical protein